MGTNITKDTRENLGNITKRFEDKTPLKGKKGKLL